MAGQDGSLHIGLLDGQFGAVEHALALGRLIASQRSGEADLHYRFLPSTADDKYDGKNR